MADGGGLAAYRRQSRGQHTGATGRPWALVSDLDFDLCLTKLYECPACHQQPVCDPSGIKVRGSARRCGCCDGGGGSPVDVKALCRLCTHLLVGRRGAHGLQASEARYGAPVSVVRLAARRCTALYGYTRRPQPN